MPIATAEVYAEMLDRAKEHGFAYPAINVTSSQTLNAALRGFAEADSDGIVQVSTGGADYLSGSTINDMTTGAAALASYAHIVADKYPVHIALHTDHCPKNKLDGFMRPLVAISKEIRDPPPTDPLSLRLGADLHLGPIVIRDANESAVCQCGTRSRTPIEDDFWRRK